VLAQTAHEELQTPHDRRQRQIDLLDALIDTAGARKLLKREALDVSHHRIKAHAERGEQMVEDQALIESDELRRLVKAAGLHSLTDIAAKAKFPIISSVRRSMPGRCRAPGAGRWRSSLPRCAGSSRGQPPEQHEAGGRAFGSGPLRCHETSLVSEHATAGPEALRKLTERTNTMTTRSVVLLATLLVALPASAQDQFEEATRATAAACVEFLTQERLPACVLALQRQVLQLQSIVQDRGQRIAALEEAVRVLSDNQRETAALGHCHDWQPECEPLLQNR